MYVCVVDLKCADVGLAGSGGGSAVFVMLHHFKKKIILSFLGFAF